ncbi:MAG TPA: response regulator [Thermoanaerobaculia bacterium]|nr:response regulator [Thermoanaerobaculia bacterium]
MPKGNVLVVEDDESIRRLLIEYLEQHADLQVDGARDGVDALHHVSTRKYAVVVLDVMMPYMTGIDFLDSLEALTSDPSVRHLDELPAVLVITGAPPEQIAAGQLEQRFPAIVRGMFRKPVDAGALVQKIESLLC